MSERAHEWSGGDGSPELMPEEFIAVGVVVAQGIDRRLGYLGEHHYGSSADGP